MRKFSMSSSQKKLNCDEKPAPQQLNPNTRERKGKENY
jgi:hypothetical protein